MKRHKLFWLAAVCLAAGCVYLPIWWMSRPLGISEKSFQSIKLEMNQSEVVAIIGMTAGDYGTPNAQHVQMWRITKKWGDKGDSSERWTDDYGILTVNYDVQRRVVGGAWTPMALIVAR